LGWRWLYYGDLLPNTFYAKVGTTPYQILRGLDYVYAFSAEQHWPLLALLVLALLTKNGRRVSVWHFHLLSVVVVYLIYVIFVGGDWMGSGRFMVPVLPLAVIVVAEMLSAAVVSGESVLPKMTAIVSTLLCMGMLNYASGWNAEWANVSRARLFHQSRLAVAHWLREHARPGDTLLTNEIGLFAYYSGLYVADLHGLTDTKIAHAIPASPMGRGKAGHEKFDLDYSFSKQPTWICAAGLTRIYFEERASFPPLADYEAVVVDIPLPFEYYRYILHRRGADTAKPVKYVALPYKAYRFQGNLRVE
jgi:arabinofuranosyltransferase